MTIKGEFAVAVVYTDQGPRDACAQDCRSTSNWTKVWLFKSDEAARAWLKSIPEGSAGGRKRAYYTMVYADPDASGNMDTLEAP